MKDVSLIQKMFGSYSGLLSGKSRVPLRSNVFENAHSGGYGKIGSLSRSLFNSDRKSPLLGNAGPSKVLSSWYSRIAETKQYELIDISRTAVSFFRDYVNNFLSTSISEIVTIMSDEIDEGTGSLIPDKQKTDRINDYLLNDIKIFDFIHDHLDEAIYYGAYYSGLRTTRDAQGHLRFHIYGLYDPVSVCVKRQLDWATSEVTEEYIARGDDGNLYTLPHQECFYLGSPDMRLINDLSDDYDTQYGMNRKSHENPAESYDAMFGPEKSGKLKFGNQKNRDKVIEKSYYTAGYPLFYSSLLKVKELVVKELLLSLLSLRDLCTPSLLSLMFDKGVPMENADELCKKVQKMMTSYNDLSSFLSAQFDATSLIEQILSQNVKVIPDYNATLQNKGLIQTDKLGDKYLELLQGVEQCRQNVLSPLGIPLGIMDSTAGNKWQILQSSERANSRVNSIINGIKESVIELTRTIYEIVYSEKLDPSRISLHLFTKTSVEYNNSLNNIESVSAISQGIQNILMSSLQGVDSMIPLVKPDAFAQWLRNIIKNADPSAADLIDDDSVAQWIQIQNMKYQQLLEQYGMGGGM